MLRSNFSSWQETCVDEKTKKVISILKDMSGWLQELSATRSLN